MKIALRSAVILFVLWLSGAVGAERGVVVTLVWLNHAEKECKSCSTQIITMEAGTACYFGEECRDGPFYLKVSPRWRGDAIEVALTPQVKPGGKDYDDGPAQSVVVRANETKPLELRGIKFAVSAVAAPDQPSPPKKDAPPSARS